MIVYYLAGLAFFLVGYYLQRRKRSYENFWKFIYAIPGPEYNQFIGNTQAYGKDPVELFYMMWNRAKLNGPIFKIWTFYIAIVFLLDPRDIEIVLSSTKHMSKGNQYKVLHNWLGTGLLTSTGSKWQQRRKILTPAFHFTILQDFVGIFNRETNHLVNVIKNICNQPFVNVLDPVTEYTLNSIGETSLGIKMSLQPNRREYKEAIYKFGYLFVHRLLRPWLRINFIYNLTRASKETNEVVKLLHSFSTNVIKERKQSFKEMRDLTTETKKRRALIDILLEANIQGLGIDEEGIREEVDTFMFEGHDTTTLGLSYLLLSLANEPKWQEEVRQEIHSVLGEHGESPNFQQLGEMKLMERCIKESLRLYPSVPVISRVASEEFRSAAGYIVPKAVDIQIPIFQIHRSEAIWENPEKYDPDRFVLENSSKRHPFAFIPFSAGPRNCIGQRFAILEMKAALCGILKAFNLEAVDKPEDIIFKSDLVLRPNKEIRVKFIPREGTLIDVR